MSDTQRIEWDSHIQEYSRWMKAGNRTESTIATRTWWIRNFLRYHDFKPISSIRTDDILYWAASESWSPVTRKSAVASVKSLFDWAVRYKVVAENPTLSLMTIRVPRSKSRPTPDQILEDALDLASCTEEKFMLLLAAYAGLRRAEIAALHTSNVDSNWISVTGKGGTTRIVPVHPALGPYLSLKSTGYYFPGRFAEHRHPDYVGRRISRLLGPGYTAHNLRHWFATSAFKNSRNIRAVQELLGHASVSTTQIYVDVPYEDLQAAVMSLPYRAA